MLGAQYDDFEPLPGLRVNGALTMGENIADNAGDAWRSKEQDGALRQQILSDVHTPDKYRVIGITRNQDAWYAAFGVKPGDKYYLPPDQRVHMW